MEEKETSSAPKSYHFFKWNSCKRSWFTSVKEIRQWCFSSACSWRYYVLIDFIQPSL